jgi:hypothetical protein
LIMIASSSITTVSMRSRTTLARSAGERLRAAAKRVARSSIFLVWPLGMPAVPNDLAPPHLGRTVYAAGRVRLRLPRRPKKDRSFRMIVTSNWLYALNTLIRRLPTAGLICDP